MTTKISWEDVEKATDKLAQNIKTSGFKADYSIGITTGGLIPLALLSKSLNIERILTVSASSYDKHEQKELVITYLPEADLSDKKILLVDEIAETGTTLKKVSEAIVEKYKIGELKTATIGVNKDKCVFTPDFSVVEEKGGWIVFPWEKADFPEYF